MKQTLSNYKCQKLNYFVNSNLISIQENSILAQIKAGHSKHQQNRQLPKRIQDWTSIEIIIVITG